MHKFLIYLLNILSSMVRWWWITGEDVQDIVAWFHTSRIMFGGTEESHENLTKESRCFYALFAWSGRLVIASITVGVSLTEHRSGDIVRVLSALSLLVNLHWFVWFQKISNFFNFTSKRNHPCFLIMHLVMKYVLHVGTWWARVHSLLFDDGVSIETIYHRLQHG
jgi:hypothetical protein